ncbi:abraxas family member [Holotrichia oblita]|uniref:Abraxas family member n=1 Tax=Holotrichia oblita TaxID=644536 RepID=A0ACB9SVZ9_HOLOL|nr:abraxas family member [Holotrichia oblita]
MVETLSVSLSGPAFSLLLYENVRTKYDQEGFLLGEIIEKKTNSITDNDEQVTKIDRIIKINSPIPCPKLGYFYDAAGQTDEKKIQTFLGSTRTNRTKVIAWYKFKHTNAFKMTIREKIVHKQLSQYFVPDQPELFTCCLLTTNSSVSGSTHLYSQTFLRYIEPSYQMLPMHIVNLSDSNNSHKSIEPTSETFNSLVKSLRLDQKKMQGINVITQINEELQKRTEDVATQLAEAEKKYFELQEEVLGLQEKLKLKLMSNDVNMIEVDKNDRVDIVENGSGDDVVNSDCGSSIESFSEVTKGNRGRKKSIRTSATRNSSRSPVKVEVNVDNIISNRTRNRTLTPSTGQKK